ncbi:MAG: hypothetical protein EP303_02435 [Deltaproteobacteria bacterium]|nr:MAG: hypothetical protein EP303_02435 [Deltaproteobacteria bacterium]
MNTRVLALHILKQRERLAERAQRVLHAGLAIRFGRGVFGLEERPDGLRDVLGDPEYFLRNVSVLL